MGLRGRNASWRSTRDRFSRFLEVIKFNRVSKSAYKIARKVLKSENITFDASAIESLTAENPGDLRALVRDSKHWQSLQMDTYPRRLFKITFN